MTIGSVLIQPQRVQRGHRADPDLSLIWDFGSLLTRLTTDAKTGGRVGEIARGAVEDAFARIVAERVSRMTQAGPHAIDAFFELLRAITGVSANVSISAPSDALTIGHDLLEHFAAGIDGLSAAEIRPHVASFLNNLEKDLGFSVQVAETELWGIVDEIADRLESAPPETDPRARSNRLECACIIRRIRRVLQGRFAFPRLDADVIANLIAKLFVHVKAPAFAAKLRCVADALEAAALTGQAVEELVPMGTFSEFRSLGAAAAAAQAEEQFCWYATWLFAKDTVINKERTQIRSGNDIVKTGTNLTLKDIPEFKPDNKNKANESFYYAFKRVDLDKMDTVAYVTAISADMMVLLFHAISTEEGDFVSNLVNMLYGLTSGTFKIAAKKPMVPVWADDWLIPAVITILASIEGIHTEAEPKQGATLWATLLVPDFGEERLYRGYGKTGRNFILSLLTLVNHNKPANGAESQNYKEVAGFSDLIGFGMAGIYSLSVPRDDWGLQETHTDPKETNFGLIFGWILGFASLGALTGRVIGGLLAWAMTGSPAPAKWFGQRWWHVFEAWLWYIGVLFWWMEGNTDGGHYNPDEAQSEYNGYPDFATSPYTLPYSNATLCYVGQGNHGLFSHNKWNGNQTYAYDFSLDEGTHVLAARPGTVVDWFDWVIDNENVDTDWPDASDTTLNPEGVSPATDQTSNSVKNFILIRHDRDDTGAILPAGKFDDTHDLAAGGMKTRTYTSYLHGRQGSVREAFKSRGIDPAAIIGSEVRRGHWIMNTGSTGKSPHNHLHFAGRPGPDNSNLVVPVGDMGDELPVTFRDVTNLLGTDGVPTKLNWYRGSMQELS